MGGDLLVALDELVALAPVQPPLAGQLLEALPLRVVREHVRVQVHAGEPRLSAMSAPEFAMLTADDLVTGEAVALDLPPASLGARMASGPDRRRGDGAGRRPACCFLAVVATADADARAAARRAGLLARSWSSSSTRPRSRR